MHFRLFSSLQTTHDTRQTARGFTLVEMIVAVALFSVVMIIAAGSLLSIVDANRKAQAIKSVMNNLNFALEDMARNIRVGANYHCGGNEPLSQPQDCADTPSDAVAFRSSSGDTIKYSLDNNRIMRSINGGAASELTAPEILVDRLNFYVSGTAKGADVYQPKILMVIGGELRNAKERVQTRFDLQTLITERASDF